MRASERRVMHPQLGQAFRPNGNGSCLSDTSPSRVGHALARARRPPAGGWRGQLERQVRQAARNISIILSISLRAHRAAEAGSAASTRGLRRCSSSALRRPRGSAARRPLCGGHSTSNSLELIAAASRSPSTANASTILPPDWRTVASGNGTAVEPVPVSSSNSRSAASAGRLARLDHRPWGSSTRRRPCCARTVRPA